MSGLRGRLLALLSKHRRRQELPLDDRQRALITTKFDMLQQASFGFTEDRLLHLQPDGLRIWSESCTEEFRAKITSAAPPGVQITLLEFRALGCISLQCRAVGTGHGRPTPHYGEARAW